MNSRCSALKKRLTCLTRVLLSLIAFLLGVALALTSTVIWVHLQVRLTVDQNILDLNQLPVNVDCIIVPGAQIYANRKPSPMLQDRLDGAVALFKSGYSDRILVSGDHREDNYNEPYVMHRYLIEQGIPDEAIFMDHFGLDTYDTIYRAHQVFGIESAIIATQRFHLERALFIADKVGMQTFGYATDPRLYNSEMYMLVREMGARLKAVYETRTGAIPRHSSPARPIHGDGRSTRDSF